LRRKRPLGEDDYRILGLDGKRTYPPHCSQNTGSGGGIPWHRPPGRVWVQDDPPWIVPGGSTPHWHPRRRCSYP
jgi:hypothetical protein